MIGKVTFKRQGIEHTATLDDSGRGHIEPA